MYKRNTWYIENLWKPQMFIWPNLEKLLLRWILPINTLLFNHLVRGWLRHYGGLRLCQLPQMLQLLSQGPVAPVMGKGHTPLFYLISQKNPELTDVIFHSILQLYYQNILLKEEILHHSGCTKQWLYPNNNNTFSYTLEWRRIVPSTVYKMPICDVIPLVDKLLHQL